MAEFATYATLKAINEHAEMVGRGWRINYAGYPAPSHLGAYYLTAASGSSVALIGTHIDPDAWLRSLSTPSVLDGQPARFRAQHQAMLLSTAPTFSVQPSNVTVPVGNTQSNTAEFSVSVSGATSVKWQVDDGGGFVDVVGTETEFSASGFGTETLSLANVTVDADGYVFKCVASNDEASTESDAATLTARPANPSEIFGLALWAELPPSGIDATVGDGNPFQTWTATTGSNWSQATANSRPLFSATGGFGGGPAVRFEVNSGAGANRFLNGPDMSALTAGEIFCRLKADDGTPAGAADGLWHMGSSGQNTLYPFSGDSAIYESFGTNARKDAINTPGAAIESWHVYNVSSASGAWSARRNETVIHSTGTNTVAFPASPKLGESQTLSRQLTGYTDYIVIVSRPATDDERADMRAFLGF